MAKKSSGGMKVIMDGLRHTNLQNLGADSSVVAAEAISNPAYLETNPGRRQGMLIKDARVYLSHAAPVGLWTTNGHTICNQIQTGDQTGTPALMEITDAQLVATAQFQLTVATNVGFTFMRPFPFQLEPVMGMPLIVTPEFTVVHDFDHNNATYQNEDVYTVIDYAIVEVNSEMFSTLLLNQSRVS